MIALSENKPCCKCKTCPFKNNGSLCEKETCALFIDERDGDYDTGACAFVVIANEFQSLNKTAKKIFLRLSGIKGSFKDI